MWEEKAGLIVPHHEDSAFTHSKMGSQWKVLGRGVTQSDFRFLDEVNLGIEKEQTTGFGA